MAYVKEVGDTGLLQVECRVTKTALLDAAHLEMSEDDLARVIALLVRDPSIGRKGKGGFYVYKAASCEAKYMLRYAREDLLVVYLMRVLPLPRARRDITGGARFARDLALAVLRDRITKYLDASED